MKESDLEIYDVFETPSGNLFIKMCDDYSIAIGTMGSHAPLKEWGELENTQYVKKSDTVQVKKVGRIVFD